MLPKAEQRKKNKKAKKIDISHEALQECCKKLHMHIPQEALPPLAQYLQILMRWNSVMNLVGADNWKNCLQKLIIDSVHLAKFLENLPEHEHPHIWDLGAGAGLPGIPLRMLWKKGEYTLVEIREKRSIFLNTVLAQITLENTHVFQGDVVHFLKSTDHKAHIILSRAFMPWQKVVQLVKPHLADDGRIIFLSLEKAPEEELNNLGFTIENQYSYKVAPKTRWFWSIKKDPLYSQS